MVSRFCKNLYPQTAYYISDQNMSVSNGTKHLIFWPTNTPLTTYSTTYLDLAFPNTVHLSSHVPRVNYDVTGSEDVTRTAHSQAPKESVICVLEQWDLQEWLSSHSEICSSFCLFYHCLCNCSLTFTVKSSRLNQNHRQLNCLHNSLITKKETSPMLYV